jgi:hypothetical protein
MIKNSEKIPETLIYTRLENDENNSLIQQENKYNSLWASTIKKLEQCLSTESEKIWEKIYHEEIERLNSQIILGKKILEYIKERINTGQKLGVKIPKELFELEESIEKNLNLLKSKKEKLEEEVNKIFPIFKDTKENRN